VADRRDERERFRRLERLDLVRDADHGPTLDEFG
jgi:hypothetical protein